MKKSSVIADTTGQVCMKERILIADDDPDIRDGCAQVLSRLGAHITETSTGREALRLLGRYEFDLLLLDLKMPDVNGLDLLRTIREQDENLSVIMITAYGTIQNAVEAMKMGANDFLPKPFEPEELRLVVRRTCNARRLVLENMYLREELKRKEGEVCIIGQSRPLLKIFDQVQRLAPTDSTVLITGESGTGKGLIARHIHELSLRHKHPFVSVDCSTLVPSLFESELFGHVKGAFTGAEVNKVGKFELAGGGTLFLDEISNINMELQAKLLKAVEEKEISRVGSQRITKVDVRIIAATNQDLKSSVQQGKFREDLYFRLNVVALRTPTLRQRRDDIPLLADFFLKKAGEKYNRPGLGLTPAAIKFMQSYHWPGNVRELENTMERVVIFATRSAIDVADIEAAGLRQGSWDRPEAVRRTGGLPVPEDDLHEVMTLQEIERRHILKVLEQTGGNRTEAARLLKIDRKTLRHKLKKGE